MAQSLLTYCPRQRQTRSRQPELVTPVLPRAALTVTPTKAQAAQWQRGFTDIATPQPAVPATGAARCPDPGCAGLYVVVQPSGKKSFAVRYRFDGRPHKLTLAGGLNTCRRTQAGASDALLDLGERRRPQKQGEERNPRQGQSGQGGHSAGAWRNYLKREGQQAAHRRTNASARESVLCGPRDRWTCRCRL